MVSCCTSSVDQKSGQSSAHGRPCSLTKLPAEPLPQQQLAAISCAVARGPVTASNDLLPARCGTLHSERTSRAHTRAARSEARSFMYWSAGVAQRSTLCARYCSTRAQLSAAPSLGCGTQVSNRWSMSTRPHPHKGVVLFCGALHALLVLRQRAACTQTGACFVWLCKPGAHPASTVSYTARS